MGLKKQNIYEIIDESLSELLHLRVHGHKRVEINDVIQLLIEIEEVIPEFVLDGDEFVKHFKEKRP